MKKISEPSRKRLVELAQILRHVKSKRITSVQLEQMTGWSNALIRKDISSLGYIGGVSNGYEVSELLEQICLTLNIAKDDEDSKNRGILHKCCIVGLAKLGAALLENSIFYNSGFSVIAGFDSNVNRTEILSASFPLYPASKMNVVIPQSQIEYAILTVSAETAQVPDMYVDLDEAQMGKFQRMIDALEDLDDVQEVYHNVNLPDEE